MSIFRSISTAAVALLASAAIAHPATSGVSVSLSDMAPITSAPQTAKDRSITDTEINLAEIGPKLDSVRWAGNDGTADYWIGTVNESSICLVSYLPGERWVAASTCGTASDFYRNGLAISIGGPVDGGEQRVEAEAYLFPFDVDATTLETAVHSHTLEVDSPPGVNLVSLGQSIQQVEPTEIRRANGISFHFDPLGKIDR